MMNPCQFSEGLKLDLKLEEGVAEAAGAQAQILALQQALRSHQEQLAAQQQEKQQLMLQLSSAAAAAGQKEEEARAAYEKAAAEAAAARELAERTMREAAERERERAAGGGLQLVHVKLAGRFFSTDYIPVPVRVPRAKSLPAGCRLLQVMPAWQAQHASWQMERLLQERAAEVEEIRSGQPDKKREQLNVKVADLEVATEFMLPALEQAKLLKGRIRPATANVICSQAGCQPQKVHWDYDPAHVASRKRGVPKPASVILGLQEGCRLIVFDELVGGEVLVVVPPGCMLVFDGDVAHAGAWYACSNVRVHMYLDVDGIDRTVNHAWFPRKYGY